MRQSARPARSASPRPSDARKPAIPVQQPARNAKPAIPAQQPGRKSAIPASSNLLTPFRDAVRKSVSKSLSPRPSQPAVVNQSSPTSPSSSSQRPTKQVPCEADSTNSEKDVIIEGWLLKRGPTATYGFQKRWCVLWKHTLRYYIAEDRQTSKGEVPILDCSVATAFVDPEAPGDGKKYKAKYPNGFVLAVDALDAQHAAQQRLFYFVAPTPEAADNWRISVAKAAGVQGGASSKTRLNSFEIVTQDDKDDADDNTIGLPMGMTMTEPARYPKPTFEAPAEASTGTVVRRQRPKALTEEATPSSDKQSPGISSFQSDSDSDHTPGCASEQVTRKTAARLGDKSGASEMSRMCVTASMPVAAWANCPRMHGATAGESKPTPSLGSGVEALRMGDKSRGVAVCKIVTVGPHLLYISRGSVIDFIGDAIVNAANTAGVPGGGLDGSLMRAAGPEVNKERMALPELKKGLRIPTGHAKVTCAGKLNAKCIIHAVGPHYPGSPDAGPSLGSGAEWPAKDKKLASAYTASLLVAIENQCCVVGFAPLSAGIFRGDRGLDAVLGMGVEAIGNFLRDLEEPCMEVHVVAYASAELGHLLASAARIRTGVSPDR